MGTSWPMETKPGRPQPPGLYILAGSRRDGGCAVCHIVPAAVKGGVKDKHGVIPHAHVHPEPDGMAVNDTVCGHHIRIDLMPVIRDDLVSPGISVGTKRLVDSDLTRTNCVHYVRPGDVVLNGDIPRIPLMDIGNPEEI